MSQHEPPPEPTAATRAVAALFRVKGAGLVYRAAKMRAEVYEAVVRATVPVLSAPPPDALRPFDIPSVKELGAGDRVLAEIDQDGFAFAVHPSDLPIFNERPERIQRIRYGISIVLRQGEVVVEKRFTRGRWLGLSLGHYLFGQLQLPFFNEAAALVHLRHVEGVPRLRHIDLARNTLYIDFIQGQTLQKKVANTGTAILDADGAGFNEIDGATRKARELEAYSPVRETYREPIAALFERIVRAGVAPIDVKLGNIVIGSRTGAPYWLDFEIAHMASIPGHAAKIEEARTLAHELFGV